MNPEPAAFWEASGNLKTYETGTALELRDLSAPSHYNSLAHVFITKVSPPRSVKGYSPGPPRCHFSPIRCIMCALTLDCPHIWRMYHTRG